MRFFIPALTLLAGFAAGWYFPRSQTAAPSPSEPPRPVANAGGSSPAPARSEVLNSGTIATLLEESFESERINYPALKPLREALSSLSSDNLSEFTKFFSLRPLRTEQVFLWGMFFSAWCEFDPSAAIAFIDGRFKDAASRNMFYAAVMDTWKDGSIDELLDFASEKYLATSEDKRGELALEYLRSLAERDPDAAAEIAKRLNDGEFVLELVSKRITELTQQDRSAALAAIEGLEGEAHTHAAGQFMVEWAKQDPAAAAAWLVEHFTTDLGTHPITGVAAEFLKRDPRAAMLWVGSLPEGVHRGEVVAGAFAAWVQSDSNAAIEWLRESEVDALYDPAVIAVGQHLATKRPQEVMEEWVPKISDPSLGNELLYEVSLAWQRDNLRDFSQWIENTQAIPPETKQRLLTREIPGEDATRGDPAAAFRPTPQEQGRLDGDGG